MFFAYKIILDNRFEPPTVESAVKSGYLEHALTLVEEGATPYQAAVRSIVKYFDNTQKID